MPYYPPLSSAAVIAALGYTPVNRAGDTMTGALVVSTTSSTLPLTLTNTDTSASRQILNLNSVNTGTPAATDTVYLSGTLTNSAAAQIEFGRVSFYVNTVTSGAEVGEVRLGVRISGILSDRLKIQPFNFSPISNDGVALGSATTSFSDLFLASGGVINFANGNYTITHSSGLLTFAGNLYVAANEVTNNVFQVTNGVETFIETTVTGHTRIYTDSDGGPALRLGRSTVYFEFERSGSTGALSLQGNQIGANDIVLAPTSGDVSAGRPLATDATTGFLWVPSCAGTPTGTPAASGVAANMIPIVVDRTNHKLYFYSGAAWRDAGP